jgi:hypothetical protein
MRYVPMPTAPAEVPGDLQLDLLVDGELPEADRARLLRYAQDHPEQWRTIALRFLSSQTERQTVLGMLKKPAAEAPPGKSLKWSHWRLAAGLIIAAGVAGFGVVHWMRRGQAPHRLARNIASAAAAPQRVLAPLPEGLVGLQHPLPVSVPVLRRAQLPRGYPFLPLLPGAPSHVVVVPDGGGAGRAVAFPVREAAYRKVY